MDWIGSPRSVCSSGGGRAGSARQSFGRRGRLCGAMLLSFCLGVANGCYTYVPVASAPPSGSVLSLQLNDTGRVALGATLGPTVERIQGAVESSSDSAYVLRMQSVTLFNGQSNGWTGERVVVGKRFVTNTNRREFSTGKTTLAVVVGVGAVVAFVLTRGLLGSGNPDTDPGGGGPPTGSIRLWSH